MTIINLAVFVIILIVILYYFCNSDDKSKSNKSKILYNLSNGSFDKYAKGSLKKIKNIKNKSANDHLREGNIMEYNILGRDLHNANIDDINVIAQHYTNALNITDDEIIETMHETPGGINNLFNTVGGFIDQLTIDYNTVYFENLENINQPQIIDLVNAFNTNSPVIQTKSIEQRKINALQTANNKKEAVENYYSDAKIMESNSQNVHSASEDLKKSLNIISSGNLVLPKLSETIEDVREFIEANYLGSKRLKALRTLDVVSKNNEIYTFKTTEGDIFNKVWNRSKHTKNKNNKRNIMEAVVDALADSSTGNNGTICINGRCGRYLGSLTLLDYNKEVGKIGTCDSYKNEIMVKSSDILNNEIKIAKKSSLKLMRDIGKSYDDITIEIDDATENEFIKNVKALIHKMIDGYIGKISNNELNRLREEAISGI